MTPQIVYEDNDIIAINKPAGLITHQKNIDDKQPSVVDWVVEVKEFAAKYLPHKS